MSKQLVAIMTTSGAQMIEAHVEGPFAIHRRGREWKVSHLASGFAIPFVFPAMDAATAFAKDVMIVRNDWWTIVKPEEVSLEQRKRLHELASGRGGKWQKQPDGSEDKARAVIATMRPLNGMEQH